MHTDPDRQTPNTPASPPAAAPTTLALRRVAIDTYRENVAYLHRDCAVVRAEGFQALSKVAVRANGQRILATLNIVDDPVIVGGGELIRGFLDEFLVDEITVAVHPVVLGGGIPFIPPGTHRHTLRLVSQRAWPSGLVQLTYVVQH